MPVHVIDQGNLSASQRTLIEPLLSAVPGSVRVHFGAAFSQPPAYAVTFRKPGLKPRDQDLARLYAEAPEPGPHFIVAVRQDAALDDLRLLLSLGHELEHVRQEHRCPGLLELGNLARDFVADNHHLFPDLPCELFVAVNLHAEARAARDASAILGTPAVRAHYAAKPELWEVLDRTDPDAAATELAAFLSANWANFEVWYGQKIRPTKPPLEKVKAFAGAPWRTP